MSLLFLYGFTSLIIFMSTYLWTWLINLIPKCQGICLEIVLEKGEIWESETERLWSYQRKKHLIFCNSFFFSNITFSGGLLKWTSVISFVFADYVFILLLNNYWQSLITKCSFNNQSQKPHLGTWGGWQVRTKQSSDVSWICTISSSPCFFLHLVWIRLIVQGQFWVFLQSVPCHVLAITWR